MITHRFIVHGTVVEARELPYGQLAVWHPLNGLARDVVEPLCRGRGYWKARYNNWIVHKHFVLEVLAGLRSAAD